MVRLGFLTGAEELCSLYTVAGNERIALGRTIVKHVHLCMGKAGREGGREEGRILQDRHLVRLVLRRTTLRRK